jgi:hypothetical protein
MGLRPTHSDEKHRRRRMPGEYGSAPGVFFRGVVRHTLGHSVTAPCGHGSESALSDYSRAGPERRSSLRETGGGPAATGSVVPFLESYSQSRDQREW